MTWRRGIALALALALLGRGLYLPDAWSGLPHDFHNHFGAFATGGPVKNFAEQGILEGLSCVFLAVQTQLQPAHGGVSAVFELAFEVMDADTAGTEGRIANELAVELRVGANPFDHEFVQGLTHAGHGLIAILAVGDYFCD